MYRYKNLLVPLSLADKGELSIRFAGLISRLAKSERVTFVHVISSLEDVPKDLKSEFPDIMEPSVELAKKRMEELVSKYLPADHESTIEYKILKGSPLIELLRMAKETDTDLVIMVRRFEPTESGVLPHKVIRRVPCSVVLLPEGVEPSFSNILVPTDFSENSTDAMDVAVAFASAKGIEEIHCLHAYYVPIGYYKTGKSFEQFAEIMKGHAEKNYENFMRTEICQAGSVCQIRDLKGIKVTPIFMLEKKPAKAIETVIKDHDIDLLVIGARGRHAGAGILLGSVTEHQLRTTTVPILAVKKKGTGMNLLDAILQL